MLYRLFLYKSTAASKDALVIGIANRAIAFDSKRDWDGNEAAKGMLAFDAAAVKGKIESFLGKLEDKDRTCVVKILSSPGKEVDYLYVATSYRVVKSVLPMVHAVATEYGLVLFDAEMQRTFFSHDLYDDTFVTMKNRAQDINNAIQKTQQPIWRRRQLDIVCGNGRKSCAFVVTLKKDPGIFFEKRVEGFYDCLRKCMVDGERINCENRCFTIEGTQYKITYCLEGYKKCADKIGHIKRDQPKATLIYRMSCEAAFKWLEGCSETEQGDTKRRMHFTEMLMAYPNPADRFVQSVLITKKQRKEIFDIRYSGMGYYGSEILFHVVNMDDSNEDNADGISILKIEEESATFLLPIIEEIYPYFSKRYYLTENHLPWEMWRDILDRLKEFREIILHDPRNEKLKSYIKEVNLFVLGSNRCNQDFWERGDGYMIRNNPTQFLYNHRYEVAHLYDVFIAWSEAQFDCYGYDDLMFNIQGP